MLYLFPYRFDLISLLPFSFSELRHNCFLRQLCEELGWSTMHRSLRASSWRLAHNIVDELDVLVAPDWLP